MKIKILEYADNIGHILMLLAGKPRLRLLDMMFYHLGVYRLLLFICDIYEDELWKEDDSDSQLSV